MNCWRYVGTNDGLTASDRETVEAVVEICCHSQWEKQSLTNLHWSYLHHTGSGCLEGGQIFNKALSCSSILTPMYQGLLYSPLTITISSSEIPPLNKRYAYMYLALVTPLADLPVPSTLIANCFWISYYLLFSRYVSLDEFVSVKNLIQCMFCTYYETKLVICKMEG